MQGKAAAVASVNSGILRLVGVIHDTVLAVLDIGMYFDIVVCAKPLVQVGLVVGGPQDGSVQHAVVHEAVGQTADVDAATLTVLVGGQLDLLITLNQNLGALKREDVLFALAEVHIMVGAVGQNEVIAVLVPVVLVVVQSP